MFLPRLLRVYEKWEKEIINPEWIGTIQIVLNF